MFFKPLGIAESKYHGRKSEGGELEKHGKHPTILRSSEHPRRQIDIRLCLGLSTYMQLMRYALP
jgi:hypothetical protein